MSRILGNKRAQLAAAVAAVLLASSTAYAIKLVVAGDFMPPGVDAEGNFDLGHLGAGTFVAKINTKNGKLRYVGDAQVPNESGAKQKYKNDQELVDGLDPTDSLGITRSLYKVSETGEASIKLSGRVDPELLP